MVEATLVDHEAAALGACDAERRACDVLGLVALAEANPFDLARRRATLALDAQDFVYSTTAADYASDDAVVALLDWIHATLRPGGRAMLASFHPSNPARALMEHVLDWNPYHRDEADMYRLVQESRFRTARIRFETQKMNLFTELGRDA